MRTIIHDLNNKEINDSKIEFSKEDKVISSLECTRNCIGCFSCWIKHPRKCVINDEFSNLVEHLKETDELIIISKSRYGCYSASSKRVLERCIGYVLPYFTIRNKEIHHKSRYDKKLKFTTIFYGNITEPEKNIISKLALANSINLNAKEHEIHCIKNIEEIKKCLH